MTFSIGEKIGVGKKVSAIAMLGPLLAMPSGQGLNMTLLAILKVIRANWLLVLEKNWSCGNMFLLLTRYHYWSDNINVYVNMMYTMHVLHILCMNYIYIVICVWVIYIYIYDIYIYIYDMICINMCIYMIVYVCIWYVCIYIHLYVICIYIYIYGTYLYAWYS